MKRFYIVFLILLIMFGIFAQFGFAQEKKVIEWNFNTHYDPIYYIMGSFAQYWADMVWRETDHQLKINIFYSGTLGYKGSEMMSTVKNGLLESSHFQLSVSANDAGQPWWSFNDFYGMINNLDQMNHVMKVAVPMIKEDVKNYGGIKLLALWPPSPEDVAMVLWTSKPLNKWSDMNGMKVRAYYTKARNYILDPIGLASLYLPGSEIYQGLKTGLIDGVMQTALAGYTGKYMEICKYAYAFTPYDHAIEGLMCGQEAFDALPQDVQEGLVRASEKLEYLLLNYIWKDPSAFSPGLIGVMTNTEAIEYYNEQGNVEVYRLPALYNKLVEQNKIAYPKWIAEEGGPKAQIMYDTIMEARELYPGFPSTYTDIPEWVMEE